MKAKKAKKSRKRRPEYPYTLLIEASDIYRADVFRDDEARNRFLVYIQPLVRYCVGRVSGVYGGGLVKAVDDVVGFVNLKLLESWLPSYFKSKRKADRVLQTISYFVKSVRGYVLDYVKKNYDLRTVALAICGEAPLSSGHEGGRDELGDIYTRMLAEHVALRPRPDLDLQVVEKLMRHLAWKEYRRIDGLPG